MRKPLLIVLGFIFLGIGAIGIVVPVLPTTPLVLLAAICFSASSQKFHAWLLRSRLFGPYIENYRTGQGISRRHKIVSIAFLWTGLIISMVIVRTTLIYIILGIVGIGVSIHLLTIKTRRTPEESGVNKDEA